MQYNHFMRIGILGINHKSADLSAREQFAKACYRCLHSESEMASAYACTCLFTCHRTEVYFSADDLAVAHSELLHVLREEIASPFEHYLYAYFGFDCFLHLAYVTAGLDSAIIGESDIQRQVKLAYGQACLQASLPSCLHYLFQKCLKLGKYARSQLTFPAGQITVPRMVYETSSYVFNAKPMRVLCIGNSEINRQVIAYIRQKGPHEITLCTRSVHSAQGFAMRHVVALLPWEERKAWTDYDLLISGTNASSFVVQWEEHIPRTRLIFDLGVPRNVDPQLSKHPQVVLRNMDELGTMLERRQRTEGANIRAVESALQEKVRAYVSFFHDKRVGLCVS
jgi:glutamyl-tRNA reductase